MFAFARKAAVLVCALALILAGPESARANIIRSIGPSTFINEPEGLIKFDAAFDTINQVYLVVWGTQATNARGMFLNVNGQPIGSSFLIQSLSGWIRVTYSAAQQTFMVNYTRITFWPPNGVSPPPQHARFARFISYNAGSGTPNIGSEIFLDNVGTSPGNSTGVAYSPAYNVFFATWHKYVQVPNGDWSVPRTYVAAISPTGTVLAINELTNPEMGQSDANIACNNTGRCLVVGFAWNNATWGRLIDGPLGTPVGAGPWDIHASPVDSNGNPVYTVGDGTVAYSALQDKFVVLYVRSFNKIWGNTVLADGTTSAPFIVMQSTPATESLVGPGYGVPNLSFNSGTGSFLVSGRDYYGRSDAQEADSNGLPLAGSWDQIPPNGESEYVNTGADPINRRLVLFDNQNFNSVRITLYEVGDPRILNGDFNNGTNNWLGFASPDSSGLTTNVTGGVYQFYRTLPLGDSNFAVVYQDTAMSFVAGTRLLAQFDLGNSSSVPKTLNVMLHTNFADQKVCSFTLAANSPLRTYRIRAVTSVPWAQSGIMFDPQTVGADGGYYLLDNVSLAANPSGTNSNTECVGPVGTAAPRSDVNGDGTTDVLWAHTDGRVALWLMSGASVTGGGGILGAGTGWSPVRLADLNGDGKSDVIWQHTDGSAFAWLMNGATVIGGVNLLGPGTGWSVRNTGDFNGDGKQDILWRHTDGSVALWLMDGPNVIGGGGLLAAGSGWDAVRLGDFNGDGKQDIVWQHTDGRVALWLMDGASVIGGGGLLDAGTGWSVRLIGDLDGDGKSDILWQHTDGRVSLWLMNGANVTGGGGILGAGTGWTPVRLADFNGDGRSDILWQHTNGSVFGWLMNGASIVGTGSLFGPGTGWTVSQTGDYNTDGKQDILWRNTDGSVVMWLMNGLSQVGGGGLLGTGTGWSPAP